jgi:hypothetical protein
VSVRNPVTVSTKVNVSMVSLKWGDVLSTLLPGALVVFALAPYSQSLGGWLSKIDQVGPGVALLIVSALAGEVLGAVTRIGWERFVLVRLHPSKNILPYLRDNPNNMELYERGVQSSYKYVTFYANFAWAIIVFLVVQAIKNPPAGRKFSWLVLVVAVLLRASYVQWTYFVNYQTQVFEPRRDDAAKRSAAGNQGEISAGRDQGSPHGEGVRDRHPDRSAGQVQHRAPRR